MTSTADTPANCWSEGQSHDFVGDKCIRCGEPAAVTVQDKPSKTPRKESGNEQRMRMGR